MFGHRTRENVKYTKFACYRRNTPVLPVKKECGVRYSTRDLNSTVRHQCFSNGRSKKKKKNDVLICAHYNDLYKKKKTGAFVPCPISEVFDEHSENRVTMQIPDGAVQPTVINYNPNESKNCLLSSAQRRRGTDVFPLFVSIGNIPATSHYSTYLCVYGPKPCPSITVDERPSDRYAISRQPI